MTLTAVLLITLSALLHAGWNLVGKRGNPSIAFFFSATIIGVLCLFPFLILFHSVLKYISPRIWLLILCTGLGLTLYYIGLAGAYRRGDMSIAYPMVRSLPVILVTLASIALGRGEAFRGMVLGGIGLIVIGSFALPMSNFRDFKLSNHFNSSNVFALLAAVGTVFYSLIDDEALRLLRTAAVSTNQSWQVATVYAFLAGLAASLCMGIYLLLNRIRGKRVQHGLFANLKTKSLTGIGIYTTYTLVLISMAFVKDVSYVVAFRQISLPIGVVLGVVFLKEGAHIPKFLGVAFIFAGLILVGFG